MVKFLLELGPSWCVEAVDAFLGVVISGSKNYKINLAWQAMHRKLDSIWHKELGRWTGRRSSPMEQTPQPKLVPGKR